MRKKKVVITEDNCKEILYRRALIICWAILVSCWVIKMFGGNFFNIACSNERVIAICNWLDTSWLKYVIFYLLYIASSYLLIIITDGGFRFTKMAIVKTIITFSTIWIMKLLIDINIIKININFIDIADIILLVVILYLFTKRPVRSIISVVLYFVFILLSTITKNVGMSQILTDNSLVLFIFGIDNYILLVIASIYSKKIYLKKEK